MKYNLNIGIDTIIKTKVGEGGGGQYTIEKSPSY